MSYKIARIFFDKTPSLEWGTIGGGESVVEVPVSGTMLQAGNIRYSWLRDGSGNVLASDDVSVCKYNGADGKLPIRLVWDFQDASYLDLNSVNSSLTPFDPTGIGSRDIPSLERYRHSGGYFHCFGYAILDEEAYNDSGIKSGTLTHYRVAMRPVSSDTDNGELAHVSFDLISSSRSGTYSTNSNFIAGLMFIDKTTKAVVRKQLSSLITCTAILIGIWNRYNYYGQVNGIGHLTLSLNEGDVDSTSCNFANFRYNGGSDVQLDLQVAGRYAIEMKKEGIVILWKNPSGQDVIIRDLRANTQSYTDNIDAYVYPILWSGTLTTTGIRTNAALLIYDNIAIKKLNPIYGI